jgi:hypothetical protein
MKARIIRTSAIVIVLSLLLASVAFAGMTSSAYIDATSAYITKSGSNINVYFLITGKNIMDEIGATYIYLYEKNGNTWSLVKTFDSTDANYSSAMLSTNTSIKSSHVTYTSGNSSKYYYAVVHFYAERNGGSDTYIQDTPAT